MSNKVDGINKLSKENLHESREVVLISIEQEMKRRELEEKNSRKLFNKVDGIFQHRKEVKNSEEETPEKIVPKNIPTPEKTKNDQLKPKEEIKAETTKRIIQTPQNIEVKKEEIIVDKNKQKIWLKEMSNIFASGENTSSSDTGVEEPKKTTPIINKKIFAQNIERQNELKIRDQENEKERQEIDAKLKKEEALRRIQEEKQFKKDEAERIKLETKQQKTEEERMKTEEKNRSKMEGEKQKTELKQKRDEEKRKKIEEKIRLKQEDERRKEEEKLRNEEEKRKKIEEKIRLKNEEKFQKEEAEKRRIIEKEKRAEEERRINILKQEEKERLELEEKKRKEELVRIREKEKIALEEERLKHKREMVVKEEALRLEKIKIKQEKKLAKIKRKEGERLAKNKEAEENKRLSLLSAQEREKIKKQKEAQRIIDEKRKQAEKIKLVLKKQTEAKARKVENIRLKLERQKIKAEQKIINQKIRKEKFDKFISNLKRLFFSTRTKSYLVFRKIILILLVAIILLVSIYASLIFVVTKLKLDNSLLRKISQVMPVPALFTKTNMIEYYKYQDLKISEFLNSDKSKEEIDKNLKLQLAKEMILEDLARKYKITEKDQALRNLKLSKMAGFDKDINQVPINRITRIMELIKKGDSYLEATKFGDEQGIININDASKDLYNLGDSLAILKQNKISNIVTTPEGYYIFKPLSVSDKNLELSYVLVRSNDFNFYIEQLVPKYKMWSLVD